MHNISVWAFWWQAGTMYVYYELCALICNKININNTLSSPAKIMTISDELQHTVFSMQDDHSGRHVYN